MARIGIALGSGSARGWGHIGVLRALAELGIHPEIVCGCSIGALVGAAYAAERLETLASNVLTLNKLELLRFFEMNFALNGFVKRDKLQQFFHDYVCASDQEIAQLTRKFACVATNIENGHEVWFTQGRVLDAVWASIALPGLFSAVSHQNTWLVDGGLSNPVPVSLCRALGADVVIAVNLNGNLAKRYAHHTQKAKGDKPVKSEETPKAADKPVNSLVENLTTSLRGYSALLFPDTNRDKATPPTLVETIAASINIMQDKITRSRMAGDPPDILLSPRLEHIGLLEFFRAEESIQAGYDAVQRLQAEILDVL